MLQVKFNNNCLSGFRKTRASGQGLTYTPDQCHRLRQANFLHKTFYVNAINIHYSKSVTFIIREQQYRFSVN